MTTIIRTNSGNKDFLELVQLLDVDLALRDGEDHSFYSQFNKIDLIKYTVVVYEDGSAIGCGALKNVTPGTMEIKRMYVVPVCRGKGIAVKILSALENWAKELACEACILETGKRQPEAIKLYLKRGYKRIVNYGQYAGVANSLCFKKELINDSET